MLSNCKDCKFYSNTNHSAACAVNPKYLEMFGLLVSQISYEALTQHDAILPCPDFQISEDLQEQTIELTLTLRDWKQIIRSRSKSNLSKNIVSQIRQALSIYDDETFETDDIPF